MVKRLRIETGDGKDDITVGGPDPIARPATILAGAGDDNVDWDTTAPVFVDGGDGNDRIGTLTPIIATAHKNRDVVDAALSGDQGPIDTILGGNGDDTLTGDGNDSYDGGSGTDVAQLVVSGAGTDIPDARADAIAHDYFARLGLTSVESTDGFGTALT